jgi:PAS domain S-box-containing protein
MGLLFAERPVRAKVTMDRTELRGLAGSFLGNIDDEAFELLLEDASILDASRGEHILGGPVQERFALILEGTARSYLAGQDHRQLTLRYAVAPAVVSTTSDVDRLRSIPINLQAVTEVSVVELNLRSVQRLMATNMSVSFAVTMETSRRLADVYRAFSATFFGSVTERLATHVLNGAELGRDGWALTISRQDLAVTLGTAREVVARLLARMEADGVIETRRGAIVIARPNELVRAAGQWWLTSRLFPMNQSGAVDETMDDVEQPLVAVDANYEIVYANRALAVIFEAEPRDLIERPIECLVPKPAAAQFRNLFDVSDSAPGTARLGLASPLTCVRSDGSEFPAEITIAPAGRREGSLLFATVADVSYRSMLRQLVAERAHARRSSPVATEAS